jgi:hypothetical protein
MDDKALRSQLIRLAQANPKLRPHLLPLIKAAKKKWTTCPECEANFQVEPGDPLPPHKFNGKACPGAGKSVKQASNIGQLVARRLEDAFRRELMSQGPELVKGILMKLAPGLHLELPEDRQALQALCQDLAFVSRVSLDPRDVQLQLTMHGAADSIG